MRRMLDAALYGASHAFDLGAAGLRQHRSRTVSDLIHAGNLVKERRLSSSEGPGRPDLVPGHSESVVESQIHANRLFVGSLSFTTTDDDLRTVFERVGSVVSVKIIMDRDSGRSKGFAFVEMAHLTLADIRRLDELQIGGRSITVNAARPVPERVRRPSGYSPESGTSSTSPRRSPAQLEPKTVRPEPERIIGPPATTVPDRSTFKQSEAEEVGVWVDAIFVELVWEGSDRARESDALLGARL